MTVVSTRMDPVNPGNRHFSAAFGAMFYQTITMKKKIITVLPDEFNFMKYSESIMLISCRILYDQIIKILEI